MIQTSFQLHNLSITKCGNFLRIITILTTNFIPIILGKIRTCNSFLKNIFYVIKKIKPNKCTFEFTLNVQRF